ncbi:MAG: hypothetical protein R3B13_33715 [Polyangiaceae bacterium]
MIPDREVLNGAPSSGGSIEHGTVGWEDGAPHFDREAGKPVVVKVTLFRGRGPGEVSHSGKTRAQGLQVLCCIGAPLNFIPPDGSRVLVAFPAECGWGPGAGVVFTMVTAEPEDQFGDTRSKLDFGPDCDLVIKARSITLTDYQDRWIAVGPQSGIKMGDATASGLQLKGGVWAMWVAEGNVAKSLLNLTKDNAVLTHKASTPAIIRLADGDCSIGSKGFAVACANAMIGGGASPATPAQYGLGTGSASTSVFIQP